MTQTILTLPQLAEDSVERLGERKELIFEGQEFTNVELFDRSRKIQQGVSKLGLGHGDVVMMCLSNDPLVFPLFQGIFRTGATATPVMFTVTAPEMTYVLSDCRAKGVVTDAAGIEKVREAVKVLRHIEWIVVLGGRDNPDAMVPEHSLDSLLESDPATGFADIDPDDVAMMLYTAGTTGKPKGVMLTHRNLIHSAKAASITSELDRLEKPQIIVNALPMAHIFGVAVMNTSLLTPARLVKGYTVQMTWFDPDIFLSLIHQHRATAITVVPTMLVFLNGHPRINEYDLTSLVDVVSGAAPLPIELGEEFCRLADISHIRVIYGCTECSGIATTVLASEPYRPGSAGRAFPGVDVQIFDADDKPLPAGESGEIVVRGPSVMKGYLNNPEETAKAIKNGWLHTGDIGYLDPEGYLYVVDRKKDMIIKGGENIYPSELEEIMYQHDAIAEAAVVGKPDPVFGESVVAFVVLKQGRELLETELTDFLNTRISSFKVPGSIHFVDAIPKSPVGKILKRELRETAIADKN